MAVGNIGGVSGVEDNASGTDLLFHEVQKGDIPWAISAKALGNGARYTEIFEANKPMLSDSDKIYPGQMLRIPQDGRQPDTAELIDGIPPDVSTCRGMIGESRKWAGLCALSR